LAGSDRVVDLVLELAERLLDDADVPELLTRVCERCVDLFDVRGVGIVFEAPDSPGGRTIAASDALIGRLEREEVALDEGPCVAAWRQGQRIEAPDLGADGARWPVLTPLLLEQGIAAVSSFPMVHQDRSLGSLNIFRSQAGPLSEAHAATARTLAGAATILVLQTGLLQSSHQTIAQLQTALQTRLVIEQAKGKLSQQLGLDVQQAFELLRRYARNRNLRVHDVAADVVGDRLRLDADPS
jgi:hypothetical protein